MPNQVTLCCSTPFPRPIYAQPCSASLMYVLLVFLACITCTAAGWELGLNHYLGRLGIKMPQTQALLQVCIGLVNVGSALWLITCCQTAVSQSTWADSLHNHCSAVKDHARSYKPHFWCCLFGQVAAWKQSYPQRGRAFLTCYVCRSLVVNGGRWLGAWAPWQQQTQHISCGALA